MLERVQDAPAQTLALRASDTVMAREVEAAIDAVAGSIRGGDRPRHDSRSGFRGVFRRIGARAWRAPHLGHKSLVKLAVVTDPRADGRSQGPRFEASPVPIRCSFAPTRKAHSNGPRPPGEASNVWRSGRVPDLRKDRSGSREDRRRRQLVRIFWPPAVSIQNPESGALILGFPWILSSKSRLFNGLHGFFREKFFLALFPAIQPPERAPVVAAMRKCRIAHGSSLVWFLIFCNRLSSEPLPFGRSQSRGSSV